MSCGVYHILNTVNGKSYIGSSQNIELRWRIHRNDLRKGRHHSRHLQRAWDIDGEDAFLFEVLANCQIEDLLIQEQLLIDTRKAFVGDFGYNTSAFAKSRRGVKHSDEVRAKMREAARNRAPKGDSYKEAQSARMKRAHAEGRLFTPEHRQRISESLKGRPISDKTRQKLREANIGKVTSEETREKLRVANSKPLSPENYAALLVRTQTTNRITPEIRAKMVATRQESARAARKALADAHITPMRLDGMSYPAIARKLNEMGVPTLREGCVWHAMIIRTICLEFIVSHE